MLVLDEPTSHLDPRTARELIDDVFAATEGRTVLLITHRSEGLELVDRVVSDRSASRTRSAVTSASEPTSITISASRA